MMQSFFRSLFFRLCLLVFGICLAVPCLASVAVVDSRQVLTGQTAEETIALIHTNTTPETAAQNSRSIWNSASSAPVSWASPPTFLRRLGWFRRGAQLGYPAVNQLQDLNRKTC
ncbi:MAG: hypothetical protein LBD68_10955 [Zoogloeaceae bacterium]|jgi:P pilus assembly chaperone PapD|nr:hypothetical protein [Zoogloeaceae bacterium]